jgi:hypothetical protein
MSVGQSLWRNVAEVISVEFRSTKVMSRGGNLGKGSVCQRNVRKTNVCQGLVCSANAVEAKFAE